MKDEEMAEEFADKKVPRALLPNMWERYKDSFLAGLKAGRPQWHKSSEKLPETTVLDELGDKVLYDYTTHCWRYDNADFTIAPPPVAWCEIPTFDKE